MPFTRTGTKNRRTASSTATLLLTSIVIFWRQLHGSRTVALVSHLTTSRRQFNHIPCRRKSLLGLVDDKSKCDSSNRSTATTTASTPEATATSPNKEPPTQSRSIHVTNEKKEKKKKKKVSGVYVRPSAAIERGSGFYVPGLEGSKARLILGGILLVLGTLNAITLYSSSFSSEKDITIHATSSSSVVIALAYSVIVLLEAIVEFIREQTKKSKLDYTGNSSLSEDTSTFELSAAWQGCWLISNRDISFDNDAAMDWRERIEWATFSFIALTKAERIFLIQKDTIIFDTMRLPCDVDVATSHSSSSTLFSANNAEACRAALVTIQESKSGCVALPISHPMFAWIVTASVADAMNDQPQPSQPPQPQIRTVVLQVVSSDHFFVVTSSELLASFTTQDFSMLGRIAAYCTPKRI